MCGRIIESIVCGALLLSLFITAGCTGGSKDLPPKPSATTPMAPGVAEAVDEAWKKVEADPDLLDARLQLAMIYDANNILDLAEETYEQVAERDPDQARSWYFLGRVRVQLNKTRKAMEAFGKAKELDDGYAPLHWHLGLRHLELAELDAAERAFQRAAELDPSDPSGPTGLARVAMSRNDPARTQEAREILEGLLVDHPEDGTVMRYLSEVLRSQGEEEGADALLDEMSPATTVFRKDPWGEQVLAHRVRGVLDIVGEARGALEGNDPNRALQILIPALEKDPTNVAFVAVYADICLLTGELNSALQAIDRAIEKNGEGFVLAFSKGVLLRELNQRAWPDSLTWFQKAAEFDGTSAAVFDQIARLQHDLGQFEPALISIQKAEELGMVNVQLALLTARCKMQLKRYEEAIADINAAMETYPDADGPWIWLARTRTEMRMFDEATEALAEAERRMPGHPVIPRIRERMRELQAEGETPEDG
jgi:tetratricopeptide (TPR) repeat protein